MVRRYRGYSDKFDHKVRKDKQYEQSRQRMNNPHLKFKTPYARTQARWAKSKAGRGRRMLGPRSLCAAPEKKFHDMLYTDDPLIEDWAVLSHAGGQSLNLIAQGLTEKLRVGRRICVHNINIKGHVEFGAHASATVQRNLVKLVLVMDRQANGADGAVADVYEVETLGLNSYRNLAAAPRFKILKEEMLSLKPRLSGNGTDIQANAAVRYFNWSIKLEEPIEYTGATGAITEIQSVNFFLMGCSFDNSTAELSARCRLRFTD